MKKLVLICILIALLHSLKAQTTIYASLAPADLGFGYRVDNRIGAFGLYTAVNTGSYKFTDDWFIKDHIKIAIGGLYYTRSKSFFSFGISTHSYGEVKAPYDMPYMATMPFSCEIGTGVYFKRFSPAIRIDPLKRDVALDFGIKF